MMLRNRRPRFTFVIICARTLFFVSVTLIEFTANGRMNMAEYNVDEGV